LKFLAIGNSWQRLAEILTSEKVNRFAHVRGLKKPTKKVEINYRTYAVGVIPLKKEIQSLKKRLHTGFPPTRE